MMTPSTGRNLFAVTGLTNKSLRALTARLLGSGYTTSQRSEIHRRPGRPSHLDGQFLSCRQWPTFPALQANYRHGRFDTLFLS